jgi:hypothetical protein
MKIGHKNISRIKKPINNICFLSLIWMKIDRNTGVWIVLKIFFTCGGLKKSLLKNIFRLSTAQQYLSKVTHNYMLERGWSGTAVLISIVELVSDFLYFFC